MGYTQKDIELLLSHNKQIRIEATLLDNNYQKVESLSGRVKSAPYSISSESDIRRTSSITLTVPKKDNLRLDLKNTWIDRMVDLECGIFDRKTNDYNWYNLGRMLMVDGSTTFDASTQEVKLSLMDLMASMTADRGSQMGLEMLIPAGSNVRNSIIAIVTTFSPFKRYNICEFEDTIPYDIVVSAGKYPYDALKEILSLFPTYEMFYDKEGIFTVQKIPTKIEEPIDTAKNIMDKVLIKYGDSVKMSNVKNTTEIWGRSLKAMYTASECKSNGSRYNVTIGELFEALVAGETYGITPQTTSVIGQTMKIQETEEYKIYEQAGDGTYSELSEGKMISGIPYVLKYVDGKFVLQGELEIHVIVQEIIEEPSEGTKTDYKANNACREVQWVINPESPFACVINGIGDIDREIRQVLQGGEYSNIYTTELAYERARYETWLRTRLQDTVTFESILVPWMDANDKIEFTAPDTGKAGVYIVQTIDYDFARWTMSVKCSRFYPYYPW